MNRRKLWGLFGVIGSIGLLVMYTYLLFFTSERTQQIVARLTLYAFVVFLLLGFILVGIGILRTPQIPPIRELNDENTCSSENNEKSS